MHFHYAEYIKTSASGWLRPQTSHWGLSPRPQILAPIPSDPGDATEIVHVSFNSTCIAYHQFMLVLAYSCCPLC